MPPTSNRLDNALRDLAGSIENAADGVSQQLAAHATEERGLLTGIATRMAAIESAVVSQEVRDAAKNSKLDAVLAELAAARPHHQDHLSEEEAAAVAAVRSAAKRRAAATATGEFPVLDTSRTGTSALSDHPYRGTGEHAAVPVAAVDPVSGPLVSPKMARLLGGAWVWLGPKILPLVIGAALAILAWLATQIPEPFRPRPHVARDGGP